MSAKTELFDRIKHLDHAISLPVLIDNGIIPNHHNGAANLLRKGLAIVAFNVLEDFIKNKSLEALKHVSESGLPFSMLPSKLQEASITGALNALTFRAKIEKKDGGDWKLLVQEEALKIHSTKNENFELSKFSLLSANSNIGAEEVTNLIGAFGINGGWSTLKTVSDKIGGGLTDLNQSYKNAADRRHNAAHSAAFRYEYQWLSEIKHEILSISASLDILLTARCRQIDNNLGKKLDEHNINNALKYRFLEDSVNCYKETAQIGGRSKKNWSELDTAIATLRPQLRAKNEFLVILDTQKRIKDWYH